jgi:eukaryotic-like serine/threonine-protein kinase
LRLAVVRRTPVAEDALQDIPALTALFSTLREATARYPSDAELWLELGDAGYHFGELAGMADTVVLRDFERAIALDSMVLVPYVHAYNLALRAGKYREAATYVRRLASLSPPNAAPYYQLQGSVLDSAPRLSREASVQLDTLPLSFAGFILQELRLSPEATALSLAVAKQVSARLAKTPSLADSAAVARLLLLSQAQRGKTIAVATPLVFSDRAQLALAGLLPVDVVLQEARAMLSRQPAELTAAVALFAGVRDTVALAALGPVFESIDVATRARGDMRSAHFGEVLQSYMTLARGDSAAALRGLLALPMSMCNGAPCAVFTTSRLLMRAGRDADAARVLDRALPTAASQLTAPLLMLERAAAAERLGDKPTARRWYGRLLAQWGTADASVQATVAAARAGLDRVR